jgi:Transposase
MNEEPNTELTELKKPGRPCKYTPETVTRLLSAVEAGLTLKQSCKAAGISETTLYEWRGEYPELEPRLEAARERAREDALRVIQEAGKKDWRAKEAWLRLSFQSDYRPAGAKVEVNTNAIADNLSKAGWSWGSVASVDREGRTTWIADAHRGDV